MSISVEKPLPYARPWAQVLQGALRNSFRGKEGSIAPKRRVGTAFWKGGSGTEPPQGHDTFTEAKTRGLNCKSLVCHTQRLKVYRVKSKTLVTSRLW